MRRQKKNKIFGSFNSRWKVIHIAIICRFHYNLSRQQNNLAEEVFARGKTELSPNSLHEPVIRPVSARALSNGRMRHKTNVEKWNNTLPLGQHEQLFQPAHVTYTGHVFPYFRWINECMWFDVSRQSPAKGLQNRFEIHSSLIAEWMLETFAFRWQGHTWILFPCMEHVPIDSGILRTQFCVVLHIPIDSSLKFICFK